MSLTVCLLAMAVTLGAGGALTEIGPWYYRLAVPRWKPPNWAFGPIWTAIGLCAAFSAWLAWKAVPTWEVHRWIEGLFGANAVLNILWSLFFFKLHRPDWALYEVPLLWLSVLAPIVVLWSVRPLSSLLLVPYLIWVSVAAALNLSIVRLNAPFGAPAL